MRHKGKSINNVLEMTVDEALVFFYSILKIANSGAVGPLARSFKAIDAEFMATLTVTKATFYNGYGTLRSVTNIQEVVKWLTTERF